MCLGHFHATKTTMHCKHKYFSIQFACACLALANCLRAATVETINVADTFCSDVEETLKINGTIMRQDSFHLCMDVESLNWRRDDIIQENNMMVSQIFTHSDNTVYKIYYDAKQKAVNCTTYNPTSPTTENDLPFRFAQIDNQAALNGTTKIKGVSALRYRHLRPARKVGPGLLPAEDMNWFISKNIVSAATRPCETRCYENLPQGVVRAMAPEYFQKRYSRNVPEDTFKIKRSAKVCHSKDDIVQRESCVWRPF